MRIFSSARARRWLASALAVTLTLGALPAPLAVHAAGPSNLPNLGDGSEISLSSERRLGDRIARSIYRDPDYVDDPILTDYLQAIWQPLLAAAQKRGDVPAELSDRFAWKLVVSRDRSVNAFALPGGYLGVHLGLVATTTTAGELASVLAHELSHVSQRHIARLMTHQQQQAPWILAAMILGALAAGASKNADIGGAAMVGGQALAVQQQLNFSRDMEREADRIGFGVLTDAGFDGAAFGSMFERLQQASRHNDDGSFPYLRSHPLTTERMADMRGRIPMDAPRNEKAQGPSPLAHALVAARARVLGETDIGRQRAMAQIARSRDNLVGPYALQARLYAGALSAVRLRDSATAIELTQTLAGQLPGDDATAQAVLEGLAVDVLLAAGPQQRIAGQNLDEWSQRAQQRRSRAGLLLRAQAVRVLNEPQALAQTTQALQARVAEKPDDAPAWQALAALSQLQNQPLRAIRAEAEAQVAKLDYPGAADRLRAAQNLSRGSGRSDHIEATIIDARLREVERLVRETERQDREDR